MQGAVLREKEGEFYQQLATLRDRDSFLVGEFSAFVDSIRYTYLILFVRAVDLHSLFADPYPADFLIAYAEFADPGVF